MSRFGSYLFCIIASLPSFADLDAFRPEVRTAIDNMIKHRSRVGEKPVAVFDWDNTMAKHDISDAVFHEMLARNMIFAPPGDDLRLVNKLFSDAAIAALKKHCKRFTRKSKKGFLLAGSFYKTKGAKAKACRQEFLHFYHGETTAEGEPAFDQSPGAYDRRAIKPSYLWVIQTLAGMSRDDVHALTNEVLDARLTKEAKARRTEMIDEFEVPSFLEIYEPMAKLVDQLMLAGFDVWIVSASSQYVVETFAQRLDQMLEGRFSAQSGKNHLEKDPKYQNQHVIGVQVLAESGEHGKETLANLGILYDAKSPVLVNKVQGCGWHGENEIITYIKGKPCFIDVGIFGGDGKVITKRPIFAAGDATTDVAMLQSASRLALVINRNYSELMCNAYQNKELGGKKWIVQPMFIDPCPKRQQSYKCNFLNEKGETLEGVLEDSVFVPDGSGKLDLDCRR